MSRLCSSCLHSNLDVAFYCAKCGTKIFSNNSNKDKPKKEEDIDKNRGNKIQTFSWRIVTYIFLLIVLFIFLVLNKEKVQNSKDYDTKPIEVEKRSNLINKFSLDVRSIPYDSKIQILNISQPYEKYMMLDKGDYHILVSKKGYKTFDKWITVDKNVYVDANLEQVAIVVNEISKKVQEKVTEINSSSSQNISSKVWECNIEWIIDKGEKFKPTNENLQTLSIELIDGTDRLHLKTQNGESIYKYDSFIDLKDNNLGMNYTYGDRFIGIFQNKTLFLGDSKRDRIDMKYYCKDMVLDITKLTSSKTQKELENILTHQNTKRIVTPIQKFSLSITTMPSPAKIKFLNIKPTYYDGMKLKKGKYHIEVSKKGYRTIDKWITLKQNENFNFELKKIEKYIAPKVIKDEYVISHDSYVSSKIIKHEDSVITHSVPKKMSKKERENLKTCMDGSYASLCKHSWLTPQQAIEVKRAERTDNLKTCMNGSYASLCKHSWLTPQQAVEVKKAERTDNLKTCMNGSYASLCKHSWLTPQQAIEVKRVENR